MEKYISKVNFVIIQDCNCFSVLLSPLVPLFFLLPPLIPLSLPLFLSLACSFHCILPTLSLRSLPFSFVWLDFLYFIPILIPFPFFPSTLPSFISFHLLFPYTLLSFTFISPFLHSTEHSFSFSFFLPLFFFSLFCLFHSFPSQAHPSFLSLFHTLSFRSSSFYYLLPSIPFFPYLHIPSLTFLPFPSFHSVSLPFSFPLFLFVLPPPLQPSLLHFLLPFSPLLPPSLPSNHLPPECKCFLAASRLVVFRCYQTTL